MMQLEVSTGQRQFCKKILHVCVPCLCSILLCQNAILLLFQVISWKRSHSGVEERPQFLNIKLTDISLTDPDKYPHMLSVKNCFIRGSVVRYVQLPAEEVDTSLLQDATRKEAAQNKT
ncbi:PREDICTED: U6 snRNA-associated Sm-like protein LSm2 isoform X1 [Acropora digitifera]|uniref:U6 snRNA-associated Sm-like protein LSm2 isoform X1 n=1 Tax=Acropora digitifera TaxID=70779 RepID=UPI00077AF035|nr:PREDICTED: U6 snRNA-associated Sm-like protein LSm2 isoform X1 [Acropora digitifera]